MAKGKLGRVARAKARKAYQTAKRWPRKKLVKAYAQVSGKLVAVTGTKKKLARRVRYKKRRY